MASTATGCPASLPSTLDKPGADLLWHTRLAPEPPDETLSRLHRRAHDDRRRLPLRPSLPRGGRRDRGSAGSLLGTLRRDPQEAADGSLLRQRLRRGCVTDASSGAGPRGSEDARPVARAGLLGRQETGITARTPGHFSQGF